ncbi:MAG: protein-disulfide reductase DsbD family protein [Pseudomonadota bacterium]|nr:protein-disulfide reductase DsbD family protein [Pseudomonadota bacterium]
MLASFLQLLCFLVGAASAAPADSPYRIEVADVTVAPGGTGTLRVIFAVPEGFHTYRDWVDVAVTDPGGLTLGAPSYPTGLMKDDPGTPGTKRETYESDVYVDLSVTAPATPGKHTVALHARYQGCKKALCYMPFEEDYTAVVTVAGPPVAPSATGAVEPAGAAPAAPVGEAAVLLTGKAGAPNEVRVAVDLLGDWHINKAFVSLTLVDAAGYTLGDIVLPAGEKSGDPGNEREDYVHDLDLVVPISGPPGAATVKVEVGYQACKGASLCMMPMYPVIDVPVVIDPSAAKGASASNGGEARPAAAGGSSGFAAARDQGVGALVLLCFLAGIGVSFTPCVLPMVPITMGLIGAKGAGSRVKAFSLSATYVLGLAAVYTALGVSAGVTGMLFGSWLQSPLIVFSIAGFFVVMGVSMFGFFDVGVPSFLASRLQGKAGGGYGGALGLGVIGAILAGPCSGPVVASILALIGTEGDLPLGAALMFAFSLGMGMIFLVTGAASGWLPARGAWMVTVKKGFGIVLWLGAIYFSAAHLSPTVTALSTAAVLLVTAVFGWPNPDDGEGPFTVSLRRLYGIVAGLVGAYLLLGTLVKDGFILPAVSLAAAGGGGAAQAQPGIAWIRTEAEALELAKATGKPVMIDFTAEWCAACHEMERFTYTDPRVIAAAEGFVPAMLDCTKSGDPVVDAVQKKYGVTGLPTVVFVMPDGRRLGGTVGFVEAEDFVKEMQAALEAKG